MQSQWLKAAALTDQQRSVQLQSSRRISKKMLAPLSLFSLAAFSVTPIYAANSSIEQVTIYQGLASVTRTLPISGKTPLLTSS